MSVRRQGNEIGTKRKPRKWTLIVGRVIFSLLPILIIVTGIIVLMIMNALKPELEKAVTEINTVPVLVATPSQEEVRLNVLTQGEVRPRVEIDVVPQVGGKIEYISRNFLEGGAFTKGEVLIRIETADYDLRVVQAEATVAQAQQSLLREQAEAQIAARDWQELGSGKASALTLRKPQMAQAQASLAAANASLADAKLQLARTAIRAPFSGRVRSKAADVGQYVTPGARLARIFSTEVVDVRLPFSDAELAKLNLPLAFVESDNHRGPEVKLSAIVAGKPRIWHGRITRTDSAIDPTTRLMFAFVEVLDPYGSGADGDMPLVVGLFVQAEVEGQVLPNAMLIPRSALRGNNDVFLADGEYLRIVSVQVASSDRNNAIITAGLMADDKVITSPVRGAIDGMKIEIVSRSKITETSAAGE